MKVLVTGAAGYIGSLVTSMLLRQGHRIIALDSLMYGANALLGMYSEESFHFMKGDIRDVDVVQRAIDGVDAVVHLAAIVGDPACASNPELTREVNLEASLQLLDFAQRYDVSRFIFASTCSNYGKMPDPSDCVTENSALRPISLYADTKVAVERKLLDLSSEECPGITVLRFATAFGLSPRMRFDLTVNDFALQVLTNRKLEVYGQQFCRPYIHVVDIARAVCLVIDQPIERVGARVFNIGDTSQNYTKGQIVDLVCAEVGMDVKIRYVERSEDPRDYRVDFSRVRDELGFLATRHVEDGIREVADIIRQGVITDFDNPNYRN